MPSNLMLLRLFAPSIGLTAIAVASTLLIGIWLPSRLQTGLLASQAEIIRNAGLWLGAIGLACAFVMTACQTYRLRQWTAGNGPDCPRCGGLLKEKYGRYGWYTSCLHCGDRRRA